MSVSGGAGPESFRDGHCLDDRSGWGRRQHACDDGCGVGPGPVTVLVEGTYLIVVCVFVLQADLCEL